jgi:hypothetical protein
MGDWGTQLAEIGKPPALIGEACHSRSMFWPDVGFASDEVPAMGILAVLTVLLILLFASTWSSARSYFAKGRLAGMEEATLEIIRGVGSHYESVGQVTPDYVREAVEAVKTFARGATYEKSIYRYQARLWIFGDAIGAACWRKGYDICRQQMTPREGKIVVALTMNELMHLTALAHLGFKKMMPNDRAIEMHRFSDEQHAMEGTHAVELLERAIPEQQRPVQHAASRLALIQRWWQSERRTA